MDIYLYNTLTRKIEEFKPIKPGFMGMYTCGPTVYGPGHLGHARSYVNFDLLKRMFLYNGYKVKHILNITDVHDDMIKGANKEEITVQELADRYIPFFKKDLTDLNIIPADAYPRVTEHIPEIINMVKTLVDKGYGYAEKNGSVYYDVSRFKNYGKLSGIKRSEVKTGTRVKTDKYERAGVADFALWKGWKKGEPYWQSPWGKGRPGWHIECSVMANKYLGKTIDLHAGAMDLKFPHHENEIAQSEAANGRKFVNYWFHTGLLDVEGQKMSKSLGNYIEICEVKEKGFDPMALRYLFLTAHYRSKLNFTWESLKSAPRAWQKLQLLVNDWREFGNKKRDLRKERTYQKDFLKAINNDLGVPQALVVLWQVVKDQQLAEKSKLALVLDFDQILGLKLGQKKIEIPKKITILAKKRERLREKGDFKQADEIRRQIEKLGFIVKDEIRGYKVELLVVDEKTD